MINQKIVLFDELVGVGSDSFMVIKRRCTAFKIEFLNSSLRLDDYLYGLVRNVRIAPCEVAK